MLIAFLNVIIGAVIIILSIMHFASSSSSNAVRGSILAVIIILIALAIVFVNVNQPLIRFTAIFKGAGEVNKLLFYKEGVDASVTVAEDLQGGKTSFCRR